MKWHRFALVAAAALLASCNTIPTAPAPATATLVCEPLLSKNAECVRRIDALSASAQAGSWGMGGRAAITHGKQSGSLGVEWEDAGSAGFLVVLTAPITRQGWRLQEQNGRATLEGMAGGPRTGAAGAALLREATGFEIPVQSLRHWMRGYPDPSQRLDKAAFAGESLVTLEQGGWQIDYLARDVQGRPTRIDAARGDDRVRLVIDRWGPLEQ
ncbi:MAG: outer membrane lipoprotein LolB [Proteobacteria bacterium]|nr:outer membrane lipoprotein LolB [Pseudomonadota bacterium]